MTSGRRVAAALAAMFCLSSAAHAEAPLWQRLLRWSGGPTSATPVPTTLMGKHMQMSVRQPAKAGDAERAEAILAAARRVLERYRDVEVAEQEGYAPFLARNVIGEEVHYTNYWRAAGEKNALDLDRPGSILYRRTASGMRAVGVMYTARADATADELDQRVPLSIGVWHRHVHFCGWPRGTPRRDWDGPAARFGFAGSIGDQASCEAAGGYWIPLVLGWMTHIYPHESEPDSIWIGEQMMKLHATEDGPVDHSQQRHRH